ncbi:hypothetical protein [Mycolicibacterium baixiangningiae]|uniref:hypothetical protein n=1 Tax=Mycolicibacterium baixiangningiae TaxID=2761578 RepID=UPI0018683D40|nr:hypothetical protein [Mycolicibacterium baixiangningiae]
MKRRVIYPSEFFDRPEQETTTMSDDDNLDVDPVDDLRIYRGQLQAIELCRAVAANAGDAADAMYAAEDEQGVLKYLVAGLTHLAISLARTVVEQHDDPNVDEQRVWASLTERSTTGLIATHEISQITGDDTA